MPLQAEPSIATSPSERPLKVLLVSSTGGHFRGLQELEGYWKQCDRVWVTFRSGTTEAALADETVYWAWGPTNRNVGNLLRNLKMAVSVLWNERPDLVLTTGAGVAVPFIAIGKLLGAKTVFVESITRVKTLSLSAKLVRPCLDALYVHWPQLLKLYPQATLIPSQLM
ncbi:MAG: UDP-N-acetylglucosamine--LPS N-acetylglucosamine transferase [Cyanobacteria bacterium P01_E01_bin.45]